MKTTRTEKKCPTCGETKPISEFNKNRARGDGRSSHCKLCKYINCKRLYKISPHRSIWHNMIRRCYDVKCDAFHNYGGRGITVCEAWRNSFEAFKRDMGPRPSHCKFIDRIDNDTGYQKGNCRWVTVLESNRNKSNVKLDMDKARVVRSACGAGVSRKAMATYYGLTTGAIVHVLSGKTWRDDIEASETAAYRKVETV